MRDEKTQRSLNFEDICVQHYDEIFHFVRKQVDQTEDAKDLTQEIFMKVYNKLHTYNHRKASIRTWIYRIAYNHVMNHHSRSYQSKRQIMDESYFNLNHESEDILENVLKQERVEIIIRLMKKILNKKHQKITNLYFFGGFTYQTISDMLKVPVKTVRNVVNLSIQKIKKRLEELSYE